MNCLKSINPEISIIVPIYNPGKRKLKHCIESILKQSYKDFELLLINDGSTDDSLKTCQEYAKKDNRIVVIDKENEGTIKTRQKGIEISKGEYITFVDSDDYIDNEYLLRLYEGIGNADISVCNIRKVFGNYSFLGKDNRSYYFEKKRVYEEKEIRNEILPAYFHGHPFPSSLYAKLFKRKLLVNTGKYLKNIKFLGDDLFLSFEALLRAKKLTIIPEILYYYRFGGGTSRFMPAHFNDIVECYKVQKSVLNEYEFERDHSNGIKIMLLNSFNVYIMSFLYSNKNEIEIKNIIKENLENEYLQEAIANENVQNYFGREYSENLKSRNIDYFYKMIFKNKKKRRLMRLIKKCLSFI